MMFKLCFLLCVYIKTILSVFHQNETTTLKTTFLNHDKNSSLVEHGFDESISNLTINQCYASSEYFNKVLQKLVRNNGSLVDLNVKQINCDKNEIKISFPLEDISLNPSGTLVIPILSRIIPNQKFCFVSKNDDQDTILIDICLPKPRLKVCCRDGMHYDLNQQSCEKSDDILAPAKIKIHDVELNYSYIDMYNKLDIGIISCNENESKFKTEIANDSLLIYDDKEIRLNTEYYDGEGYVYTPVQRTCLQRNPEGKLSAYYCDVDKRAVQERLCAENICVKKCCPEGQVISQYNPFDCHSVQNIGRSTKNNYQNKTLIIGRPLCKKIPNYYSYTIESSYITPEANFIIMDNGSAHFTMTGFTVAPHLYCADEFLVNDTYEQVAIVCLPEDVKPISTCKVVRMFAYQAMFVVSSVCMGIVLLIFIGVPDLQQSVYDKCLAIHCSSLLCAFIILIIKEWATQFISMNMCITVGLLLQFSFLCSFFWLNILCFHIISLSLSFKSAHLILTEEKHRQFLKYCVWGFGGPIVMVGVTMVMQGLPPSPEEYISPGIGNNKQCWFKDNMASWAYFNGVVLVLTTANILFFLVHLFAVIYGPCTGVVPANIKKYLKDRLVLNIQLLLVMGLTWVAEVVAGQQDLVCVDGQVTLWILPDIINGLRGVFIFIFLLMKESVQRKIKSLIKTSGDLVKKWVLRHTLSSASSGIPPVRPSDNRNALESADTRL